MTEDELAHYGVLGMKWGQTRKKASGTQIRTARRKMEGLRTAQVVALNRRAKFKKGTSERAAADKTVKRIEKDMLKSPDRAIAARMTRGEKAIAIALAGPTAGVSLLSIVGTSAVSRRIEKKQDDGAYNNRK